MRLRGPATWLVVLVLLAGLLRTDVALDATRPVAAAAKLPKAQCHGLDRADVRGLKPTYTRKPLASFPNSRRMCHGTWLPEPRRTFVPQGLAFAGRTAWISGFQYRPGYGERPCSLMRVDLATGRLLQYHPAIFGRVGDRPRTYCRHGGGILQRGSSLWLVEKNKLWLVVPSRRGANLEASRVWRIQAPVRGSAIVSTRTHLGLVPYASSGVAHIYWFSLKKLLRRGVLDLSASATRGAGRKELVATSRTRVPRYTQGAALDWRGRLWLARSNLACGELIAPTGRRLSFVPGAEGIQFDASGTRLWAVSESGAVPYVKSRKPFTPAVAAFEVPRLVNGRKAACGFARW